MAEVDARKLLAQAQDLHARYARRLGWDEAADLVGEALARGLERPPADGRMEPWLERIARNLLVDRWRHAEVAARAELELPSAPRTPEELALERERRRALRQSVARLPRAQRRSILARFCESDEAASGPTARTRLRRALDRLRQLTRGALSVVPPWRLFHWLAIAANPAAVAVVLLAAPPSAPVPVMSAPVAQVVRHIARHTAAAPFAPVPPSAPVPAPRAKATPPAPSPAPALQRYDFEDDQIDGTLQRPDGIIVISSRAAVHSSLIEIPRSFVVPMIKSIEDL